MNCLEAIRWINEQCDGELPDEAALGLAGHVESCPNCRIVQQNLKMIISSEISRPLTDPGPAFTARVLAHIHVQTQPVTFWQPTLALCVVATMLIIIRYLMASSVNVSEIAPVLIGMTDSARSMIANIWSSMHTIEDSLPPVTVWLSQLRSYAPILAGIGLGLIVVSKLRLKTGLSVRRGE